MVAEAGLRLSVASAAGFTARLAVAILPALVPVTVWAPVAVAVAEAVVARGRVALAVAGADAGRRRAERQGGERPWVDSQAAGRRLPQVGPGQRVGTRDGGGASGAGAAPVRSNRK